MFVESIMQVGLERFNILLALQGQSRFPPAQHSTAIDRNEKMLSP
jgi:hypothetical protein